MVPLNRAPMIRSLLVVQVSDTSNMRSVAVCFRPINRPFLCAKGGKHNIALGFDHIIVNARPFGTALWSGFYVDGCHNLISLLSLGVRGA